MDSIDTFSHSLGLLEGWCMGKDAPQEVMRALRDVNRKPKLAKLDTLEIDEEMFLANQRTVKTFPKASDMLIEKEAARVEKERAAGEPSADESHGVKVKKPRKPFSPQELERRRMQLAEARARRKKKDKVIPRDPNTKDMFEKNV